MIKPKKSLGQNFLIDGKLVNRIIEAVAPQSRDLVVEIGPGKGVLTVQLAKRAGFVIAVEADSRLVPGLRLIVPSDKAEIVEADALQVNWAELVERGGQRLVERVAPEEPAGAERIQARVVANLPYYISTAILQRLISVRGSFLDMTLMLQEEVVDRIISEPGGKEYGVLSVLSQFYCEVEKLFTVSPNAFKPAPKVQSAVIRLVPRKVPAADVPDESWFFGVVKGAFSHRRKTLFNNLMAAQSIRLSAEVERRGQSGPSDVTGKDRAIRIEQALRKTEIDGRRRAETLSIGEFAALCAALHAETIG